MLLIFCSLILAAELAPQPFSQPTRGSSFRTNVEEYKKLVEIECSLDEPVTVIRYNVEKEQPLLAELFGRVQGVEINRRCSLSAAEMARSDRFRFANKQCRIAVNANQIRWKTERGGALSWEFTCGFIENVPMLAVYKEDGHLLGNQAIVQIDQRLTLKNLSRHDSCSIVLGDNEHVHQILADGRVATQLPEGTIVLRNRRGENFDAILRIGSSLLLDMAEAGAVQTEVFRARIACQHMTSKKSQQMRMGEILIANSEFKKERTNPIKAVVIGTITSVILLIASAFVGLVCYRKVQRFLQSYHQPPIVQGVQKRRVRTVFDPEFKVDLDDEVRDYFQSGKIQVLERWPGDRFKKHSLREHFPLDFHRSVYEFIGTPRFQIPRQSLTIGGELGAGSFGIVFEGKLKTEDQLEEAVAVKLLAPASMGRPRNESLLRDFLTEIANLQVLADRPKTEGHENVLKLIGTVFETNNPMIVIELCDSSLIKMLREAGPLENPVKPIPIETSVDFLLQIAKGMLFLHQNNFLHRDLSCRNVLIRNTTDGFVLKINDFGLTRPVTRTIGRYQRQSTRTDNLPIGWMSPEAIETCTFTKASDMWSFGVVIFEVLTYCNTPPGRIMRSVEYQRWLENNDITIPDLVEDHDFFNCFLKRHCFLRNEARRSSFEQIRGALQEHLIKLI